MFRKISKSHGINFIISQALIFDASRQSEMNDSIAALTRLNGPVLGSSDGFILSLGLQCLGYLRPWDCQKVVHFSRLFQF